MERGGSPTEKEILRCMQCQGFPATSVLLHVPLFVLVFFLLHFPLLHFSHFSTVLLHFILSCFSFSFYCLNSHLFIYFHVFPFFIFHFFRLEINVARFPSFRKC